MRVLTVVLLIVMAPGVAVDSARPRQTLAAVPASLGTGVIEGRAIDVATGAPVPDVLIGLSQRTGPGTGAAQPPVAPNTSLLGVLTDGEGRFVFRDLPSGSFLLLATTPGYVISTWGQGRPNGPSRTIDLAAGQRAIDLVMPMWRHAVITGLVTDEAGEPVVGVTVRALRRVPNAAGGRIAYTPATETTTDDRGRYRLSELTPGQFLVSVPQTQVTIPGAAVDRYLQALAIRGGGSTGGALVDLVGSRSLVPAAGGGVRVGTWLLQSSGSGRLMTLPPQSPAGAIFVYPTTLYGTTGSSADPAPIAVGPGEERTGVDLPLTPIRTARVSGIVTADGNGVPGVSVRIVPAAGPSLRSDVDFESATTMTDGEGRFTVLGVPPGRYVVKVLRAPRLTLPPGLAANPAVVAAYGPGAPAVSAGPPLGARQPLTVGDADIDDLVVPLKHGASVVGRMVFDSPSGSTPTAQQLQAVAVVLASEDGGNLGAGIQVARLAPDGSFRATPPAAGRYTLNIVGVPPGWRPEGVTVGGRPITEAFDLTGDDVAGVVVSYTNGLTAVEGTIRDQGGKVSTGAEVVVFPLDRGGWREDPLDPRGPKMTQASNAGVFAISGLLPGDYLVAAVPDSDVPDVVDPPFFETLSRFATRVTLTAGGRLTQDLVAGRIK